jgi:hypothetical protein
MIRKRAARALSASLQARDAVTNLGIEDHSLSSSGGPQTDRTAISKNSVVPGSALALVERQTKAVDRKRH